MSIKPQLYNPTPISDSATQPDFGGKGSAKAYLHYLCSSNHWKQPIYECYNEEGPPHNKLFGSKVSIQSDEGCVIVECFGNNKKSKKSAAEDAAEGALWCLKYIDTVGKIPVALETPEDHDDDEEVFSYIYHLHGHYFLGEDAMLCIQQEMRCG
ncbi:endoribonuclease Dicer [Salvia divinorum]|uniref:Endoribonuclease Dicer n=1 Tax=Salvia divinorum TaxID=28513 RepID=A0ABD1HCZ5_SALDI